MIEESVALPGRAVELVRPRDSEALLDERAFEHDEFLPYWAELWPSAVALARALAGRALRGARTLELGCGLGLASVAAALAGGRVLATDWSEQALEYTRLNAARNGVTLETLRCAWATPAALIERAPWDLVIASDVLYERRNAEQLADLLPRLGGEALIADPGRPAAAVFLARAGASFTISSRSDRDLARVTLHRLRAARAAESQAGPRGAPAGG